jgi:uncharacterized lipoprotein YddW (UPF0748 family)
MPVAGLQVTRPRHALTGAVLLACACLSWSVAAPAAAPETPSEIRAMWVLRTSMTSPASIATLVRSAREHGFNTLLVQVRGRGDAYYSGGLEPRAQDLHRQSAAFDPLATVLEQAHAVGLDVHAWINVNLVSSAADLPIARTHLVHRHPEWLMVPRDLAQDLVRMQPDNPAYVGRLARWTRSQNESVEGLYASPVLPAAVAHAEAVVRDIARRYAVDGIHLDYARYPSARFDYSTAALAEFKASIRPTLTAAVRADLDQRSRVDLFAYPDSLQQEWKAFRVARMSALMGKLRTAVKSVRPEALVTVAVAPDISEALDQKMQDWSTWLRSSVVDAVCPMAYTPEAARFAQQIAAARDVVGGRAVWAGIGSWRLSPVQTIDNIRTARKLGAGGVVLFSYDSLVDPRQAATDYLQVVGRSAFSAAAEPNVDR